MERIPIDPPRHARPRRETTMRIVLTLGILLLIADPAAPQERRPLDPRSMGGGDCRDNVYNCADTPNPLPPPDTVWLEEMTWMDVRDALAAGTTTAIIPTGGIEPNGPWLATGKHNYVLRANCDAIARALENALCAPILKLVPEGQISPPTGHMRSPGTLSLRQETFEAVLTDVARSLRVHGFHTIVLIGDSGGNQQGMSNVADTLSTEWADSAAIMHIPEYYRAPGSRNVLRERGITRADDPSDELHDNPTITLNMMLTDPESVRWTARVEQGVAVIDGVSIADLDHALELAKEIAQVRADRTAEIIRTRMRPDLVP